MAILGEVILILSGLYLVIAGLIISYAALCLSDKFGWLTLCAAVAGVGVIYIACKYGPLTLGVS